MPFGGCTGAGITEYTIMETLGHGLDLAVATGQPIGLAADVSEASLTVVRGLGEQALRTPGMMAAAVSVEAQGPAIDRFVAFLGRQPRTNTTSR